MIILYFTELFNYTNIFKSMINEILNFDILNNETDKSVNILIFPITYIF